ncbi:MAG: nucleoside deaminase [Synergistaceae bacterium]|nr:nucleoside deaminase [Synergistaceae bacterium]
MTKIEAIVSAIKNDLLPLTRKGVSEGGHVFGGLVLDGKTYKTVAVGTNRRQVNPIYHGEIDTIQNFFALKDRPAPEDCIFIASHEPCSMCVSAISWSGFREIWVLFDGADMTKDFEMPVDLLMYKEIFGVDGARNENSFFKKYDLKAEAAKEQDAEELAEKIDELVKEYAELDTLVLDFGYPGI